MRPSQTDPRPMEILLVEDNENDVLLTQEGFKRASFRVNWHHVPNGLECMRFLRREEPYAQSPTPDLILLDLNMPIMDGREVMAEVASDESLKHLPVVVLTTSEAETDVLDMYRLRCSSYVAKPVDFDHFLDAVTTFGKYWLTLVQLPSGCNPR